MVAIDVAITNVVSLDIVVVSVRNSKMPRVADILFIW